MSLLSQFQAKPGRGQTVDWFPPPAPNTSPGGVMMIVMFHANSHLRFLIQQQDRTARTSFPKNCIQSRDFKTACFVFCSFRCLIRGMMSSDSRDLSAAAPPSV